MAQSGVKVLDEVPREFEKMKLCRAYSYMLLGMDDKCEVVKILKKKETQTTGDCDNEVWEEVLADLKEAEDSRQGRYLVYDFPYAPNKSKLVFVLWSPDNSLPVKQKMMYASTKNTVQKSLDGVYKVVEWHGFEEADASKEELIAEFSRK